MFRNILNPDSSLMLTFAHITDCIFLSLFFLMGCVPVVTTGASFAALYDASFRAFRQQNRHSWSRFLQVYKDNWKQSILPTLVFYVGIFLTGKGAIALWNAAVAGNLSWAVFAAGAVLGCLTLGILGVLFPLLSRFENSFLGLLRNTLLLSLANLPRTLLLGAWNAVVVYLCTRFILPLFFLPSLGALVGSLFLEPMFRPYMPEEAGAEISPEKTED